MAENDLMYELTEIDSSGNMGAIRSKDTRLHRFKLGDVRPCFGQHYFW